MYNKAFVCNYGRIQIFSVLRFLYVSSFVVFEIRYEITPNAIEFFAISLTPGQKIH